MILLAMSESETLRLIFGFGLSSFPTLHSLFDVSTFFNVSNDNLCHKLLALGPKSQNGKVRQ